VAPQSIQEAVSLQYLGHRHGPFQGAKTHEFTGAIHQFSLL
jgi:hypothetical protein